MKNKHYRERFIELGKTPEYIEPLIDVGYDLIPTAELLSQPGIAETYDLEDYRMPRFHSSKEAVTAQWGNSENGLAANLAYGALILAAHQQGSGATIVVEPAHATYYPYVGGHFMRSEELSAENTKKMRTHIQRAVGHFGVYNLLDLADEIKNTKKVHEIVPREVIYLNNYDLPEEIAA